MAVVSDSTLLYRERTGYGVDAIKFRGSLPKRGHATLISLHLIKYLAAEYHR